MQLHRRSSLNLQVQLAVHVSQGVTGQAGHQLARARNPRPTHLLPFHGGVGLDFPERMEETGKVLCSREADAVSHLDQEAARPLPGSQALFLLVDGGWKTEGPGWPISSDHLNEAPR